MENFKKIREDKIKLLENVLNKDKIQARVNGCAYSDIWIYNEKIKIDNLVIGYIRPKDEFCNSCNIDFYRGNIKLVTLDFEIEKDLNSEKLVCRTNNGTFDLLDMESLDEIEYAEDSLSNYDDETVLNMLREYDCPMSELAETWLNDVGIEELIGDLRIQNINDKDYGIRWSSLQGLNSIIEDLKDNEEIILFDNAQEIISELNKYYNVFNNNELTDDDLYNIGVLVNKLCKTSFDDNVVKYVLKCCDLLDE